MAHLPSLSVSLGSRIFCVTGGASGMGAATVHLLAHHGAGAIWIADLNREALSKIKDEVTEVNPITQVYTDVVDVSDPKQVDDWIATIMAKSGALHGAANVAGVSQPAFSSTHPAILEQTNEDWNHVLGVNLNGIMYCTRAQVRAMAEMAKGSHPAIVNVSSMASLIRGPSAFAYGASKVACAHFTACVAKDVYPLGIRANTVSPGNTFTAMTSEFFGHMSKEETEEQLGKAGINTKLLDPADVARSIVWLLSETALDVNGVNLPVGEGAP
ncbi:unnamed protein product [Clonostachys byssicola]|uniref:Uncharacterized protein n=1 Tax=Clonostachys byssicola TaxID=160290 RepID=A0A9N9XY40_9HYPO|nr:unnamed protein product [Clonostachys byssicola]